MTRTHNAAQQINMRDGFPCNWHREPMKVNVFNFMTGASCQLLPLFPYTTPERWCRAARCLPAIQGQRVAISSLQHRPRSAVTFVQQRDAAKRSDLRHPTAARGELLLARHRDRGIHLMTITQHQSEDGDQNEAILFRCQKCHEELLRHEYNATPKGVDGYDPSQWAAR